MAATLKVATLVIKALVKPIASSLKQSAAEPGTFREVCLKYGQFHNNIMTRIQLRNMGHHVKSVKPLPEDEAVKLGAEVFAEGMVLFVGVSAIGAEYLRKTRADEHAMRQKELQEIQEKQRREVRAIEKETAMRERLQAVEDRILAVESAKLARLHKEITTVETQHLKVTESLLKRIDTLEHKLGVECSCEVPEIPIIPSSSQSTLPLRVHLLNEDKENTDSGSNVNETQVNTTIEQVKTLEPQKDNDPSTIPAASSVQIEPLLHKASPEDHLVDGWSRPHVALFRSEVPLLSRKAAKDANLTHVDHMDTHPISLTSPQKHETLPLVEVGGNLGKSQEISQILPIRK